MGEFAWPSIKKYGNDGRIRSISFFLTVSPTSKWDVPVSLDYKEEFILGLTLKISQNGHFRLKVASDHNFPKNCDQSKLNAVPCRKLKGLQNDT